jgi:hypothetical protein
VTEYLFLLSIACTGRAAVGPTIDPGLLYELLWKSVRGKLVRVK